MSTNPGKRCCILGGCGFIGSVVSAHAVRAGWKVRVFDREGVDPWRLSPILGDVELVRGDLMNQGDIQGALDGCDSVLHFIGTTIPQTSMRDISFDIETNVLATVRLLEQVREYGIKQFFFSSSGGTVYGQPATHSPIREDHPTEPISAYGIGKLTIEKYIRLFADESGIRACVLRTSNPYGGNQTPDRPQGAVSVFLHRVLTGQEITLWGDGSVVRDYLFQEDLAEAVMSLLDDPDASGVFNLGSGVGHSLLEVLSTVEKAVNRRAQLVMLPRRSFDVPYNVLDTSRLHQHTGWRARTTLEQGIRKILETRARG